MNNYRLFLILLLLMNLISCRSGTEIKNNFYAQLEKCFNDFHISYKIQEISFEKLADFDWDYMALAQSNDSVYVSGDELTASLGFECSSIPLEQSRIYFIKNGRPVKIVDLQTGYHEPAIRFKPCEKDKDLKTGIITYPKNISRFYVMSNSDEFTDGTIFLSPVCDDIPQWMTNKIKEGKLCFAIRIPMDNKGDRDRGHVAIRYEIRESGTSSTRRDIYGVGYEPLHSKQLNKDELKKVENIVHLMPAYSIEIPKEKSVVVTEYLPDKTIEKKYDQSKLPASMKDLFDLLGGIRGENMDILKFGPKL
jgi:hypothetical protein